MQNDRLELCEIGACTETTAETTAAVSLTAGSSLRDYTAESTTTEATDGDPKGKRFLRYNNSWISSERSPSATGDHAAGQKGRISHFEQLLNTC